MGRHQRAQRSLMPQQQQARQRRHVAVLGSNRQPQCCIQLRIIQLQQGTVTIEAFDELPQPRPFDGVKIRQRSTRNGLGAHIQQTEVGLAGGEFVRQIRHTLRLAVCLQTPPLQHTLIRGNRRATLGDSDARNLQCVQQQRFNCHRKGGLCAVCNQCCQAIEMPVIRMQARHRTIIFHAQINFTALSIRHANHGLNQILVRQTQAVALEFAGQRFLQRDWIHADTFIALRGLATLSPISARSALMRASSFDADSSCGSCGTSWPEKAFFRMDWRRASACCNEVVMVSSS